MGAILLLEDDDRNARAIERQLPKGLEIVRARTRSDALRELSRPRSWRLMLFDIKLGRDRYGGLVALKHASKRFPEVPRALVTGFADGPATSAAGHYRAHFVPKEFGRHAFEWLNDLARTPAPESRSANEHLAETVRGWKLSEVQSRAFASLVNGKSRSETAADLGMKNNTLRHHIHRILERAHRAGAKARTIEELIAHALRQLVSERDRSPNFQPLR